MIRKETVNFPHQPCTRNSDRAARLHEPSEVVQIQVVRPEINKGVDADHRVEKVWSEGKRARIGVKRKDAILDARIPDALHVLRSAEPKVRSPHLRPEFASQKD